MSRPRGPRPDGSDSRADDGEAPPARTVSGGRSSPRAERTSSDRICQSHGRPLSKPFPAGLKRGVRGQFAFPRAPRSLPAPPRVAARPARRVASGPEPPRCSTHTARSLAPTALDPAPTFAPRSRNRQPAKRRRPPQSPPRSVPGSASSIGGAAFASGRPAWPVPLHGMGPAPGNLQPLRPEDGVGERTEEAAPGPSGSCRGPERHYDARMPLLGLTLTPAGEERLAARPPQLALSDVQTRDVEPGRP